jgi:predicted Zn-dependent peptidase
MKQNRWKTALLAAAVALALAPLAGGARSKETRTAKTPQVGFTDFRLANGLRVLLAPDHTAPVIAVSVTYNVGSRDERAGRTGFAHLFEHMMFQGSGNVGKGEHPMLISDNGGAMNGTTNQDRTNYFETLPANQLDLALFLEADRMRSLDISQANLDNQRAVVQEERRQSYDNQPYGTVYETVLDMAYTGFPYKHSTIGSMADLDAATLDDIRSFFRIYYAPNNAALALAGDFDPARARARIEKYFGDIPRQPDPPPVTLSETPSMGERRKVLSDRLARLPRYTAAYRTAPGNDPDFYALTILGDILGDGRTARLYEGLVEKELALDVFAGTRESRGPGLFMITADLAQMPKLDPAEKAIDAEIARVQTGGVTDEELQKAKTQERSASVGRLQTALGRANQLSLYAVYYDDPSRVNTLLPRLQAVTAEDVKRVAQRYLTQANRVVVVSQPAGGP